MNENDIIDMYINQGASPYVIAEKYGTYPNKIRRILIKRGIQLSNKSEAQKKALQSGRSEHPTAGKTRSEDTKKKISEKVYENWQNLSAEDREKRVDKCREQWKSMSLAQQEDLRKSAALAVRDAAKTGSKMEQFLYKELTEAGFNVLFHKKGLIQNDDLEIDLFISELNTAIEVDGPAHFYPIWGAENLQKHVQSDVRKSGLLLAQGFVVIRIKHLVKHLSSKHKRDVLGQLLVILGNIGMSFPVQSKRYIELEVS